MKTLICGLTLTLSLACAAAHASSWDTTTSKFASGAASGSTELTATLGLRPADAEPARLSDDAAAVRKSRWDVDYLRHIQIRPKVDGEPRLHASLRWLQTALDIAATAEAAPTDPMTAEQLEAEKTPSLNLETSVHAGLSDEEEIGQF